MLRHLIKLIWNKKGAHSLLMIEIWASFMVLFGALTMIVYNVRNYMQPIGFEYDRVWNVELSTNQDTTGIAQKLSRIMDRIKAYPEIESASRMSSNTPFSANQMSNAITYNKVTVSADFYTTDEQFAETLNLPVLSGKWFGKEDQVAKFVPVVVNRLMAEKLFGDDNAVGKVIKRGNDPAFKVTGVVGRFKAKGEFMADSPALFEMMSRDNSWHSNILVRTKPGTDAYFEAKLVRELASMVPGWGIEVAYLTDSHANRQKLTLVPVAIFMIVSGFLLTNVALGLFGVLNLNISRRRGEIGLRRALGATEGKVSAQFLGEIWVLASFSIVIGLIFAIQFPLLQVFDLPADVYVTAIFAAVLVVLLIVTLCAWYPSRQAAAIHPAIALHEE